MIKKYNNSYRIQLTAERHRSGVRTIVYFETYSRARAFAVRFWRDRGYWNGYTIRRMVVNDIGEEVVDAVLCHYRFYPLNQCGRLDDSLEFAKIVTTHYQPSYPMEGRPSEPRMATLAEQLAYHSSGNPVIRNAIKHNRKF